MEWFVTHPVWTAIIIAGVVALLIIAIVPESLVNVVDQLFQLFGRLVGTLAGEAEAGASALFGIVRGVFNLDSGGTQPAETSKSQSAAKAEDAKDGEATDGKSSNGKPSNGQSSAPAPSKASSNETPFTWVAETIFVRLLYL